MPRPAPAPPAPKQWFDLGAGRSARCGLFGPVYGATHVPPRLGVTILVIVRVQVPLLVNAAGHVYPGCWVCTLTASCTSTTFTAPSLFKSQGEAVCWIENEPELDENASVPSFPTEPLPIIVEPF